MEYWRSQSIKVRSSLKIFTVIFGEISLSCSYTPFIASFISFLLSRKNFKQGLKQVDYLCRQKLFFLLFQPLRLKFLNIILPSIDLDKFFNMQNIITGFSFRLKYNIREIFCWKVLFLRGLIYLETFFLEVACFDLEAFALNLAINVFNSSIFSSVFLFCSCFCFKASWLASLQNEKFPV